MANQLLSPNRAWAVAIRGPTPDDDDDGGLPGLPLGILKSDGISSRKGLGTPWEESLPSRK